MAYGLPRKKTVKTILRGRCYKVQEPWDLALLTHSWCINLSQVQLPFLEEITYGYSVQLTRGKIMKDTMLPSAETIKLERDYEMKRLNRLKCCEKMNEEIGDALRKGKVGLRRPLQPK